MLYLPLERECLPIQLEPTEIFPIEGQLALALTIEAWYLLIEGLKTNARHLSQLRSTLIVQLSAGMGRLRALTPLDWSDSRPSEKSGGFLVLRDWRNGSRARLKIECLRTCRFESYIPHHGLISMSSKRRLTKLSQESYALKSYARMVEWETRSVEVAVLF